MADRNNNSNIIKIAKNAKIQKIIDNKYEQNTTTTINTSFFLINYQYFSNYK